MPFDLSCVTNWGLISDYSRTCTGIKLWITGHDLTGDVSSLACSRDRLTDLGVRNGLVTNHCRGILSGVRATVSFVVHLVGDCGWQVRVEPRPVL